MEGFLLPDPDVDLDELIAAGDDVPTHEELADLDDWLRAVNPPVLDPRRLVFRPDGLYYEGVRVEQEDGGHLHLTLRIDDQTLTLDPVGKLVGETVIRDWFQNLRPQIPNARIYLTPFENDRVNVTLETRPSIRLEVSMPFKDLPTYLPWLGTFGVRITRDGLLYHLHPHVREEMLSFPEHTDVTLQYVRGVLQVQYTNGPYTYHLWFPRADVHELEELRRVAGNGRYLDYTTEILDDHWIGEERITQIHLSRTFYQHPRVFGFT